MIHHPVDCPPGMRLMKPEEREATASELERVRIKLLKALSQVRNSYPLSFPSSAIALTTPHRILLSGVSPLCATHHCDSAVQSIALTTPHRIPFSAGQLPFLCDTPSLKSKKEALEEKLQQVCACHNTCHARVDEKTLVKRDLSRAQLFLFPISLHLFALLLKPLPTRILVRLCATAHTCVCTFVLRLCA